jgi:hypothetical protein
MAPRRRSFDEVRVTQNVILQRSSDSVSPMMSAQDQRASWFETRRGRYVFRASGRLLARRDACSRVGTPARASARLLARRHVCFRAHAAGTPRCSRERSYRSSDLIAPNIPDRTQKPSVTYVSR